MFSLDLQSGQDDANCQKSEPVCRCELTEFTQSVAYDGQTCLSGSVTIYQRSSILLLGTHCPAKVFD